MLVAGVDEVGRGTLAGGVFASAVILNLKKPISGLKDSKKLSEKRREKLRQEIEDKALSFSVAEASVEEIDSLNILQASLLAMKRAVDSLSIKPEFVLVDGTHIPSWNYSAEAIIRGDSKIAEIAQTSSKFSQLALLCSRRLSKSIRKPLVPPLGGLFWCQTNAYF